MTEKKPAPAQRGDTDWKKKLAELRACQRLFRQVAHILGLEPGSTREKVLREYLLSEIFRLAVNKPEKPGALLQELQRALKANPPQPNSEKKKSGGKEGKSLTAQLEQLYGPGVLVVEEMNNEEETSR